MDLAAAPSTWEVSLAKGSRIRPLLSGSFHAGQTVFSTADADSVAAAGSEAEGSGSLLYRFKMHRFMYL